jgi:mycothiol system anti-sigma-R factor
MTTQDDKPVSHDHDGHEPSEGECTEVVRDLYLFLDRELDEERRQLILGHLEDCSPCLEVFDFEAELRDVIAARAAEDCPDHLRQRILGMLREVMPPEV